MKKMYKIIMMLLVILTLVSCTSNEEKYELDIFKIKEINLGNEADSVVINGETINNSLDFYELYSKIDQFTFYKKNKLISYNADMLIEGDSKSFINMNISCDEFSELVEFRTKEEDSNDVSNIEEYSFYNADTKERKQFARYLYKEEKAFGGLEFISGKNTIYSSKKFPMMPDMNTELADMQIRSTNFRSILLTSNSLFKKIESFESNGITYSYEEYIQSKYTIYENYIVFEQVTPFFGLTNVGSDPYINYIRCINSGLSTKIVAYYDINLNEIVSVKINGNHHQTMLNKVIDLNVELFVYDLDKTIYDSKVKSLIDYVKDNSNK